MAGLDYLAEGAMAALSANSDNQTLIVDSRQRRVLPESGHYGVGLGLRVVDPRPVRALPCVAKDRWFQVLSVGRWKPRLKASFQPRSARGISEQGWIVAIGKHG